MAKAPNLRDISQNARVPLFANVCWSNADQVPAEIAIRAFAAIVEAGSRAVELFPGYFQGTASFRLLYDPAAAPDVSILAAADKIGLRDSPFAGDFDTLGAGICGLALAGSDRLASLPITLPVLVLAPDGSLRLALAANDSTASRLPGGTALPREQRVMTADTLAKALFSPPARSRERAKLIDYQSEDMDARSRRYEYEFLLRLIGASRPSYAGKDNSSQQAAAIAGPEAGEALSALQTEYERADTLALVYGERWRSTLAARSFLLFAANLISGLIGALLPLLSMITLTVQIIVTAFSYLDKSMARNRRWRAKWLDYRRVAETARISRFCAIAGVPTPTSLTQSWIDWRVQRVLVSAEPPSPISELRAPEFLAYLCNVEIDQQIAYHASAYRRFRRLDARLRRTATAALGATIALGAIFAAGAMSGATRVSIPVIGAVSLAVSAGPGLYAALDSLRGQLDVARQASRSARIGIALRGLRREIGVAAPTAALARAAAARAAHIMHEDVSAWDGVMEVV